MRAILINPHTTSVTEVQVRDDLESWYNTLTFSDFKVSVVQPVRYDFLHSLWIDEEGLFKSTNVSFELPNVWHEPFFGCGLIIGEKSDGSSRPCLVPLVEVQSQIIFKRYRVAS